MRHDLRYSPESIRDLDDIWDYIARELCDPAAAQRAIDRILTASERLRAFPNMGAPASAVLGVPISERYLICGSYLAFYHQSGGCVYIDRILYARRDHLRLLFGAPPKA